MMLPAAPKFTALGRQELVSSPESHDVFDPNPLTTGPIHNNTCQSVLGNSLPTQIEELIPGVARVEEGRLEESSWEDHHMVRY